MALKAVFFDKDGTLIDDVPDNVDPRFIRLSHGAIPGLRLLASLGYSLFVVSNQAGIATGKFGPAALERALAHLRALLLREDIALAGIYVCPHAPLAQCNCRKPQAGLLHRAASEHDVNLSASWMVGDILHDIEAGKRAGCRTVLIDNGNETEWELSELRTPDLLAPDLATAAQYIAHACRSRSAAGKPVHWQ